MRVRVMVESCILALTTGTAFAQSLSVPPTWVRPMGVYACPGCPDIPATWLIGEATRGQVPPFAFRRVGIGPLIDMDNRRWDEEDRDRRRQEELRERYRDYGYLYPPSAYAYPRFGPCYHDPHTGHYYNFSRGPYYNPHTGRHQYVNPGPGYYDANHGP